MKKGDIVVNSDGWIGKALKVTKSYMKMKYMKCGKFRTETWHTENVRLADEVEIEDYNNDNLKEEEIKKSENKKRS